MIIPEMLNSVTPHWALDQSWGCVWSLASILRFPKIEWSTMWYWLSLAKQAITSWQHSSKSQKCGRLPGPLVGVASAHFISTVQQLYSG